MTTPYVDVLQSHVQISGKNQALSIVILDGEDGLDSKQVEDLFGFSPFHIRTIINIASLRSVKIFGADLSILKGEGIVNARAMQTLFIPRDTLRAIVEEIGTSEHLHLYRSIWAPLGAKPERSSPKKSFRAGVIRNLRRQNEKIRKLEEELASMWEVIEDLLRQDMLGLFPAKAGVHRASRENQSSGSGGISPRGRFPGGQG